MTGNTRTSRSVLQQHNPWSAVLEKTRRGRVYHDPIQVLQTGDSTVYDNEVCLVIGGDASSDHHPSTAMTNALLNAVAGMALSLPLQAEWTRFRPSGPILL